MMPYLILGVGLPMVAFGALAIALSRAARNNTRFDDVFHPRPQEWPTSDTTGGAR